MAEPTYVVGIDLGTTNSVAAYTKANIEPNEEPEVHLFGISQLVGPGELGEPDTLPSFILLPGPHDVAETDLALDWDDSPGRAVGAFARDRGAELPQRLIHSSKSWLCNSRVDRNEAILPWEGKGDVEKMSPVQASAAVLEHIRAAWNHTMAQGDEDLALENQDIILTVPASFDPVARELTVKAAQAAGLSNITLLEEPQAAFYSWILASQDTWRDQVEKGDLILVCDIGGGTSDFSLIQVTEQDGDLALERVAVGEHLLVGGDNMDLAMAHTTARQLAEQGKKLDAWQMRGLWQSCRGAKELLLDADAPGSHPVTVLGRGSGLIAGTIKADIQKDEVREILTNGFFPMCSMDEAPQAPTRAGMREMGLNYEADPAVTRHMAGFLNHATQEGGPPTAVLFNGGVMKAQALRERIMEVLNSWTSGSEVREIEGANYDLAVARGAAYYGLAKRGSAVRIRGGLSKSYYIGVEAAMPAVPGMPAPTKALCVAPFGMEEGTSAELSQTEFGLVVGEPVRFDFLGTSQRYDDEVGTVIEDWEGELESITTLETELSGEAGSLLPVTIEVNVTEVGVLELYCVSVADGQKWRLEFDVREKPGNGQEEADE